jgi:hypothetical protein
LFFLQYSISKSAFMTPEFCVRVKLVYEELK